MELTDHVIAFKKVLPDLIDLTKVDVDAPDKVSAVLLRALVWASKQINDFEITNLCRIWQSFIILPNRMGPILSLQYMNLRIDFADIRE